MCRISSLSAAAAAAARESFDVRDRANGTSGRATKTTTSGSEFRAGAFFFRSAEFFFWGGMGDEREEVVALFLGYFG